MVARCTWEGFNKNLTLIFNVIFMIFGAVMDVLGVYGLWMAEEISRHATILESLATKDISTIILITGISMNCGSVCGCIGVLKKKPKLLKMFMLILFLTVLIQLSMGIYMKVFNINALEEQWFLETDTGRQQRIDFQSHYDCCGWQYTTDSIAPPQSTPCPSAYDGTCRAATQRLLDDQYMPVANALLVFSLIEFISLTSSCYLITRAEAKTVYIGEDAEFEDF